MKTSKSPRRVLLMAYRVGKDALPDYAHRYSPKTYTLAQLFACLVLKSFCKTDYRGIACLLADCPGLCEAIGLQRAPHFTTLQKVERKLLNAQSGHALLDQTILWARHAKLMRKRVKLTAIDATGFESRHVSAYFVKRCERGQKGLKNKLYQTTTYTRFPKLSVLCDCATHLILATKTGRGPGADSKHFKPVLNAALKRVRIDTLTADAGYDGEPTHVYARDICNVRTIIPPKCGRPTDKPPRGRWRRVMATRFDKDKYGQRWQSETTFSMIKRIQGSALRARGYWSQSRELNLKAITHNILILYHRRGFLQSRTGTVIENSSR